MWIQKIWKVAEGKLRDEYKGAVLNVTEEEFLDKVIFFNPVMLIKIMEIE